MTAWLRRNAGHAARRLRDRGLIAARRPSPRPSGWTIGPPDFVGVGAQRCGTTWWYRSIVAHPEIQSAAEKEFHFFDRFFAENLDPADITAYHELFPRPPGLLTGEWTPRYMHDFWTPALLREAAPRARILIMLRDPLSRYESGRSHDADALLPSVSRFRRRYVDAMVANDALDRSLYSRQLACLLALFDREQILVLQYERCVKDPNGELQRTFAFLGVDPDACGSQPPADRVGRGHPRLEPPRHASKALTHLLRDDAERLKELVPEIDLDLWPSAAGTTRPSLIRAAA